MCSCVKWVMHGLLDWATLLELNTCVLLDNQELQRCDFVASSAFPSSSEAFADFMHSYIFLNDCVLSQYCFIVIACVIIPPSVHTLRRKHSCYLYHALHGHAMWFSNIHFMLQLRSQCLPHKSRNIRISSHKRHVCVMDNERWWMPNAECWCDVTSALMIESPLLQIPSLFKWLCILVYDI